MSLLSNQMQLHQQQASQYSNHTQSDAMSSHSEVSTTSSTSVPWGAPFPSLHLWPIEDTFAMKMIHLPEGQRIKIGRQTNNKTIPDERNALFDSKVLSRTHAEIWESGSKIYIKDLRSSNGTFVNRVRLSQEGVESEPFEIKSEDTLELGIDILSEDNRTTVHHRVAAKVYCVFNSDDAALSSRELVQYQSHDQRGIRRPAAPSNGAGQSISQHPQIAPAVMSAGGKANGLSFDHVLHKLQAELQKSKETGAELQNLTTAMSDIQDTLSGGLPPAQNGSASSLIPPQYRAMSSEAQAALSGPHGQQAAAFISLQNQLSDTQTSLSTHLDKIQQLEGQLKGHDSLKDELAILRDQMENSHREMELFLSSSRGRQLARDVDDEDDDTRSVITLMDNEDAEARVRQRRINEGDDEIYEGSLASAGTDLVSSNALIAPRDEIINSKDDLTLRIQSLSAEVAEAVQVSRNLQTQHSDAMAAVRQLTQRVGSLEDGMATKVAEEVNKAEKRWESWRVKFEDGWKREREIWEAERERLRGVVREWEEASRRGHEEVEDRELNERLDEDDYKDAEASSLPGEPDGVDVGSAWKEEDALSRAGKHPLGSTRRARRRRPSHRTTLAVRALRSVAENPGTTTPKADAGELESSPSELASNRSVSKDSRKSGGKRRGSAKAESARSNLNGPYKPDRESSESGRDSGDTLKEEKGVDHRRGKKRGHEHNSLQQPLPLFAVFMVAVAAGAVYYKYRE